MLQIIQGEVAKLRADGDAIVQKAQAEKDALYERAAKLEQAAGNVPQELIQLPEDAAIRAWEWFKGLL